MTQFIDQFFSTHYTLSIVLAGTTMLGATAGCLGAFAFLLKQSLLGDAISHAALPGIALMFLFTHSNNPLVLLSGGAIAGCIGIILMMVVVHKTPLKTDTILGIILSVFFGLGLVLLTMIQKLPLAQQSILNKFLFGNASTLLPEDIQVIGYASAIIFCCLTLFWKEFKLLTFDPDFAHACGYPIQQLNVFLTSLILIAILIGLQTVGVILMSTMLIAPAAAARQWTKSLGGMVVLSGFLGALSNIVGTLLSNAFSNLPTGPTIVIVASMVVLFSLIGRR